jgi:Purple acid Phosphatase, N-terminal domain
MSHHGSPGPYFQKEFFHNGYLKSLRQVVTSGHCPAGTTEKVNCWPMPEVPDNIDMTTGNLGLTDKEENQIVAFLETLSDGFRPYPNMDTFTGACMTGGSAATQGNDSLIPTPPLPPCASAICSVAPAPGPKSIASMTTPVLSASTLVQESPTTPQAKRASIIRRPMIELSKEHLAVISWVTRNLGGSPMHYGIVRYGTRPNHLTENAESPIRLDPDHSLTGFRVRLDNVKPRTTYYFTVDSTEFNGASDRIVSHVYKFTTH